jgi:hypothetical protein
MMPPMIAAGNKQLQGRACRRSQNLESTAMNVDTIINMDEPVKLRGCTNLKFRRLDRVVTRHYDAYIAATGLKSTQYSLLSHAVSLGPEAVSLHCTRCSMNVWVG